MTLDDQENGPNWYPQILAIFRATRVPVTLFIGATLARAVVVDLADLAVAQDA
eukprot:CAMPEP_0170470990 /NCGR_PEP_ID=MMETSP0123-20130129/13305_1 /TAXON_ID=182087 /ORGANISM="Favella ehrenbergii, Strain Fehren 1" /LENGTH=52 /DNA_ID=CAMNT_0010738381 /DNA_START=349 /DNA_END=503 /DNA_ORIENTATION=+